MHTPEAQEFALRAAQSRDAEVAKASAFVPDAEAQKGPGVVPGDALPAFHAVGAALPHEPQNASGEVWQRGIAGGLWGCWAELAWRLNGKLVHLLHESA